MTVASIVLPLAFWYSETSFSNAISSSWAKPCTHHTVAVLDCALAIWGTPKVPAATAARELRRTERLVRLVMLLPSPIHTAMLGDGIAYTGRE
jgi:hypothetical protein